MHYEFGYIVKDVAAAAVANGNNGEK